MIGKLRRILDSSDARELVLDVNGVGYLISASARTLRALPPRGETAELLIETQVREDAIRLYGFDRCRARLVPSVAERSGRRRQGGARILGAPTADALSAAIARQDKAMMARAPGVGPKLAARLVLELKDKAPASGAGGLRRRGPEPRTPPWAAEGSAGRHSRPRRTRLRPGAGGGGDRQGFRRAGGRSRNVRADPRRAEGAGAMSWFLLYCHR